jgi:hypothetical protein
MSLLNLLVSRSFSELSCLYPSTDSRLQSVYGDFLDTCSSDCWGFCPYRSARWQRCANPTVRACEPWTAAIAAQGENFGRYYHKMERGFRQSDA